MKTISCYRQAAVKKKPKSIILLTLVITAAFIAGVVVGNVTPVFGEVAAAGRAGLEHLVELYRGIAARGLPYMTESFKIISELYSSGLDTVTGP